MATSPAARSPATNLLACHPIRRCVSGATTRVILQPRLHLPLANSPRRRSSSSAPIQFRALTEDVAKFFELRHTLEKLICHNSTDALWHVFASRIAESPVWNRLSFVSCACNGLVLMDESLRLLPVVETLDLSRNRFARADNLRMCVKLKHLNLRFNQLRTIGCLSTVSCPIVRLVLRNNALTTLNGLQNLKSVEGLDLSHNIISSFSELEILASLPYLQDL